MGSALAEGAARRVRALVLTVVAVGFLALDQGAAQARPIPPPPGARTVPIAWSRQIGVGGGKYAGFVGRAVGLLGRQPTIPEWDFWNHALAAGLVTRGEMMVVYTQSPEFRNATGTV